MAKLSDQEFKDNYYVPIFLKHFDAGKILEYDDVKKLYDRDIFNKHKKTTEASTNWFLTQHINLKDMLPEFYKWIEKVFEDKIIATRLYITPTSSFTPIHTDGYNWSINIPLIGSKNSFNVWYNMNPDSEPQFHYIEDKNKLIGHQKSAKSGWSYKVTDMINILEKVELNGPVLYNTSIPHNVITGHAQNVKDEPILRIILSIRIEKSKHTTFKIASKNCKILDFEKSNHQGKHHYD